jgi:hypothetical protein
MNNVWQTRCRVLVEKLEALAYQLRKNTKFRQRCSKSTQSGCLWA